MGGRRDGLGEMPRKGGEGARRRAAGRGSPSEPRTGLRAQRTSAKRPRMPIRTANSHPPRGSPRAPAPPPVGRRERAREHAKRDILLAAAEVFARRGYAAATLAELAEAAGFAAPSLYRYFESKEEILRSLVALVLRELDATFEEPVDRTRPLGDRLEALLRNQGKVAETFRAALELLFRMGPELPALPAEVRSPRAGLDYYQARFAAWLRKNASRAELRHPPDAVARAFSGIVFSFRHCGEDETLPDAERLRLVLDLSLHGIAAPAPRRRGADTP